MACGTPVIAADRGSMPELITHGQTGFLVRDLDAAVGAIDDVAGLDRPGIADHAARRFTVETMVDRYVDVYRDVIGDRP